MVTIEEAINREEEQGRVLKNEAIDLANKGMFSLALYKKGESEYHTQIAEWLMKLQTLELIDEN